MLEESDPAHEFFPRRRLGVLRGHLPFAERVHDGGLCRRPGRGDDEERGDEREYLAAPHRGTRGGFGRSRSSAGVRATRRPPGSLTITVSTVSPDGSGTDDVFTGSTDHLTYLTGHAVEHTRARRQSTADPILRAFRR